MIHAHQQRNTKLFPPWYTEEKIQNLGGFTTLKQFIKFTKQIYHFIYVSIEEYFLIAFTKIVIIIY